METLLLHLDEELTNNRPGRIRGVYTVDDLAFWAQFYSLFYDAVYIPANFLTDSNLSSRVLKRMGIENPQSALRGQAGGLEIVWDTSRFPYDTFHEMVKASATDEVTVSLRDINIARATARLCDKYLVGRIVRADMAAKLDPKESVQQLRSEVFNPSENWALEEHQIQRLTECLGKLVERGDLVEQGERLGYGRNFYYTVFGYARTKYQQKIAEYFDDITKEYIDLRHQFLTGVDYVSHRLKAKFASIALGREIGILLPDEYNWIVKSPNKSVVLASGLGHMKQVEISAKGKFRYLLDRESLLGLTSKTLQELHDSSEYRQFKIALEDLRANRSMTDDQELKRRQSTLEDRLEACLEKISSKLNPKRHIAHKVISLTLEGIPTLLGYTIRVVLGELRGKVGYPPISDDESKMASQGVELFSSKLTGKINQRISSRESIRSNTIQLTEDVRVYLGG